jgi:hypothetical protein
VTTPNFMGPPSLIVGYGPYLSTRKVSATVRLASPRV